MFYKDLIKTKAPNIFLDKESYELFKTIKLDLNKRALDMLFNYDYITVDLCQDYDGNWISITELTTKGRKWLELNAEKMKDRSEKER